MYWLCWSSAHLPSRCNHAACVLQSGDQRFYMFLSPEATPEEAHRYEIPMVETSFSQFDGTKPTWETFLRALSRIDALLIRATYHSIMSSTTLRDLSLDTAVPQNTGQGLASIVEQCRCPPGYTSLSCQECAPGFSLTPWPLSTLWGAMCGLQL